MSERGILGATDGALKWVLDPNDAAARSAAHGVGAKETRSEFNNMVGEEDEGSAGALC